MRRPVRTRSPEATRQTILAAAMREFAAEGFSGARTDAITRAAGVNPALLFYYFGGKEDLYGAVLDKVYFDLVTAVRPPLSGNGPVRERLLRFVQAQFDHVAASPLHPRLIQREMMRAGRRRSPHLRRLAARYIRPLQRDLTRLLQAGMRNGEFQRFDPHQLIYSMIGMINFYFSSVPVIELLERARPLSPAMIARRRREVQRFISLALFKKGRAPR
jgi:TetR/AcrR family transcriptional regulator